MRLHPGEVALVQGAVQQVGEQLVGMIHASSSDVRDAPEGSPRATPSARPSAALPRKTLDFTVPTGISSTAAISSYGQILHVGEHEDDPELLRHLGEGSRDVDGEHDPLGVVGGGERGLGPLVALVRGDLEQRAPPFPSEGVVAGVHGDPMEPRREGGVASEAAELPERGEEGVLRRIGGFLGVAQDPQAQVVDARAVALDEDLEGLGAAVLESPDEQLVGLGGSHRVDATARAVRRSPSR